MRPGQTSANILEGRAMRYTARMLDAKTGGEGHYEFDSTEDLFKLTADEIVTAFFDHIENDILKHSSDWEMNSVMKNRERRVVTAMGSLILDSNEPPLPFLLMIAEHSAH